MTVTIDVTLGVTKGVKAGNHELSQSTYVYRKCLTGCLHFCSVSPYVIPLPVNCPSIYQEYDATIMAKDRVTHVCRNAQTGRRLRQIRSALLHADAKDFSSHTAQTPQR